MLLSSVFLSIGFRVLDMFFDHHSLHVPCVVHGVSFIPMEGLDDKILDDEKFSW